MVQVRSTVAAITLIVAVILGQAGPAQAATPDAAKGFIQDLGERALGMLRDEVPAAERNREFRHLFTAGFDVPRIARFVLGRFWRRASDAQKREYVSLFEEYIVDTYAARFGTYSGESFQVGTATRKSRKETLVTSNIQRPDAPSIRVDWRVLDRGDKLKIVDVVVEGVSMAITHRSEFASVINNNGGRIDALLERLRAQIAKTTR